MTDIGGIFATLQLNTSQFTNDVDRAKKALEVIDQRIEDLRKELKSGAIDATEFANRFRDMQQSARILENLGNAADKAAASTRNLGYAGLTAGRALQDFTQGGIGGILNNIEGLVTGLGGGPGLAGILTAVGVAAFVAKPYIASMLESLTPDRVDPTASAVERLTGRIEALKASASTDIFARIEMHAAEADLKRLTKAAEAYNEARGLKSKAERESEAAVKGVLGEANEGKGPGQRVEDDLHKSISAEMLNNPQIREQQAALEEFKRRAADEGLDPGARGRAASSIGPAREALNKMMEDITRISDDPEKAGAAQQRVGQLLAGDPKALAAALRKAGRGGVAHDIDQVTPEAIKRSNDAGEELEKMDDENQYSGKQITKDRLAREQKAKKDKADLKRAAAEVKRIGDDEVRRLEQDERDEKKANDAKETAAKKMAGDFGRSAMPHLVAQAKAGNAKGVDVTGQMRDNIAAGMIAASPDVEREVIDRAAQILAQEAMNRAVAERAAPTLGRNRNRRPPGDDRAAAARAAATRIRKDAPSSTPGSPDSTDPLRPFQDQPISAPKIDMPNLDLKGDASRADQELLKAVKDLGAKLDYQTSVQSRYSSMIDRNTQSA